MSAASPDRTALLTDLAAQVATRHSTIPAVSDPAHQRHGPRRTDVLHGPAHTRRITRSTLAAQAVQLAATALDASADLATVQAAARTLQTTLTHLAQVGAGWIDMRPVWRSSLTQTVLPGCSVQIALKCRPYEPMSVTVGWKRSPALAVSGPCGSTVAMGKTDGGHWAVAARCGSASVGDGDGALPAS